MYWRTPIIKEEVHWLVKWRHGLGRPRAAVLPSSPSWPSPPVSSLLSLSLLLGLRILCFALINKVIIIEPLTFQPYGFLLYFFIFWNLSPFVLLIQFLFFNIMPNIPISYFFFIGLWWPIVQTKNQSSCLKYIPDSTKNQKRGNKNNILFSFYGVVILFYFCY